MGGRWVYIVAKDLASQSYGSHWMTDMSLTLNTKRKGIKDRQKSKKWKYKSFIKKENK